MTNKKMQYKINRIYISEVKVDDLHLAMASTDKGLLSVDFDIQESEYIQAITKTFGDVEIISDPRHNELYEKEIRNYFLGKTTNFTVPLDLVGTEFQKQVWRALMEIPYGETVSYKDIAAKINNPKGVRAVGMANNRNKIPIIIPCHRVIGADGSLVGYGGGLHIKEKLLQLEGIRVYDRKVVK